MKKVRVYEYAKEIGKQSKDIISVLKDAEIEVSNHMSMLTEEGLAKLDSVFKKVKKDNPNVKYYIEMNSDKPLKDEDVGIKFLVQAGKNIIKSGDKDFEKIEIDPEEFKVLIFTSGTTSNSKGVMICNRNLAANINCIPAYITLYPSDRLFSVLPLHHTYESTIGFLYPISQGASIAICEGLKYIVNDLKESEPTAILAVPLLVENFYKKIMDSIKKSRKDKLVNCFIISTVISLPVKFLLI